MIVVDSCDDGLFDVALGATIVWEPVISIPNSMPNGTHNPLCQAQAHLPIKQYSLCTDS